MIHNTNTKLTHQNRWNDKTELTTPQKNFPTFSLQYVWTRFSLSRSETKSTSLFPLIVLILEEGGWGSHTHQTTRSRRFITIINLFPLSHHSHYSSHSLLFSSHSLLFSSREQTYSKHTHTHKSTVPSIGLPQFF